MILLIGAGLASQAANPTLDIKVDQAGYRPNAPKVALVSTTASAREFTIRRTSDGAIVLHGQLTVSVHDSDSGDSVEAADFSGLRTNGRYYVDIPGMGRSWDFGIGPDVYARAYYLAMRAFYGQRCGTAVDLGPEFPGYKHGACHLDGAYHVSSGKSGPQRSVAGWHDAGDYGRYMVNSGISTGTLLWTWEMFGKNPKGIGSVRLNIPESGNNTPDILNEIRWNLTWMLSLQDTDGGVWHKQTSDHFCAFIKPEADTLTSLVIGTGSVPFKSSCATADFAAVMAIAARDYQPYDATFAKQCLQAAESAWDWLERFPNVTFQNPKGITTGAYGDGHCDDERLWASAELSRTTGKPVYAQYFLGHFRDALSVIAPDRPPSWANVAALGLWTYALGNGADRTANAAIRDASIQAANAIVDRGAHNPYRITLRTADYIWGSNGVAANYGLQLLVANALHPDRRYVETALENLHYLLGRNTFSLSWVTQVGEHPFQHPHHRPSAADGLPDPWPGLMSGGPNAHKADPAMKKLPDNLPPAKMYLDETASYATNEVAINWNAPLVFLLAGVITTQ